MTLAVFGSNGGVTYLFSTFASPLSGGDSIEPRGVITVKTNKIIDISVTKFFGVLALFCRIFIQLNNNLMIIRTCYFVLLVETVVYGTINNVYREFD